MLRSSLTSLSAIVVVLAISTQLSAQVDLTALPSGAPSGNAGQELTSIRRSDIGIGYTAGSLNQIALQTASASTPYVGGYNSQTLVGGINTNVGGSAAGRSRAPSLGVGVGSAVSKPFSGASTSPTISPYLNLFREDFGGNSDLNYQTLVRPQLQQQQFNQDFQRQQLELNRRIQSLSARQDYNPQGSESQLPTGHQTTFRYHSHFYPTIGQNRRAK